VLRRWRLGWSVSGALAGVVWVSGVAGLIAGAALGIGAWVLIGRMEPPGVRRARAAVRTDLPPLVSLLAATLGSGAAPAPALEIVCSALPGPAADRLSEVRARLALGVDPGQVWSSLAADPALGPVGRCLARAHVSGAPVAEAVAELAAELASSRRAEVEDRARAVGVKAALPLGLCLLPSFLVLGIVPMVAGLLAALLG
jgi:pilus assembly protein TadC